MSYKKSDAISWTLHALKIVIGDESIREEILMHYHPELHKGLLTKLRRINHGKQHIRTFNAFVKQTKNDTSFDDALEKKKEDMRDYLSEIVKLDGTIVFTATNMQRDADDFETHFQTFIVDNDNKTVLAIDPAYNKTVLRTNKKNNILAPMQGIYYAEVTHEVIKPFFEKEKPDYDFRIVPLSHPAQIAFDDVFCQSWSLFILDSLLSNRVAEFEIPDNQIDKYDMILRFYKRMFNDIPTLKEYLKNEYKGEIIDNYGKTSTLLKANPAKILMAMTKSDMK
jgi:hypothetical protein